MSDTPEPELAALRADINRVHRTMLGGFGVLIGMAIGTHFAVL